MLVEAVPQFSIEDDDIKVDKDVRVKPISRENRIIELIAENESITVHQLANALM